LLNHLPHLSNAPVSVFKIYSIYSLKFKSMKPKKNLSMMTFAAIVLMTSCKKDDSPTPPPDPAPTVTSISPASGPKNTVVTITGSNFGTNPATLKVYFNNVQATVQTATNTTITVVVPATAGTGTVKVEKSPTVQVTGPVFTYLPNGTVTTIVLTGTATTLNHPSGIVRDAAGNLFVCDRDNHRIVKITSAGVTSVFAGGTMGFVNGTGAAAQFNQPYAITIDPAGNLYVGDRINHAIRKITPAGVVTTLAGNGSAGNVNGTGSTAMFNEPLGVAVDASGNVYVADYANGSLRKVTAAGVVTTLTSIPFIFGVTADAAGNVYCAEYFNHQVSKYSSAGAYTVIAGQAGSNGNVDAVGTVARFTVPAGISVDASGNLYITETVNNKIRKITGTGAVTTIAGNNAGLTDGVGDAARFDAPIAVTGDFTNNTIYVADFNNNKIRKVVIE
jgi:sugar lactone lactonase YvrE